MAPLLTVAIYSTRKKWALDERLVDRIREAAGDSFDLVQARCDEDLSAVLPETQVLYGFRLTPETLLLATRLEWVQATGAGIEHALFPQFVAAPVVLTNASGIHAVQISEQAIGMAIALIRRFPHYIIQQREKNWDSSFGVDDLTELSGKTMGIVGLGRIGEALASRARAFGMKVLGVKRSPLGYTGAADEVMGPAAMERLFKESDFVVSLLPLTPSTQTIISAELIRSMKPTAYFLNFGRGKTVDQNALVKALASGSIAGAALDVFAAEPLPHRSKLWTMENVIITPHIAGLTDRYWDRATMLFCENIRRYVAGEELANIVDKELGY